VGLRDQKGDNNNNNAMLRIACVLFPQFELLDVCGPLEFFGMVESVLRDNEATTHRAERGYEIKMTTLVPSSSSAVGANQGPALLLDQHKIAASEKIHVLLVPGGAGCRSLVGNAAYVSALRRASAQAGITATVCTGSALLSRTGLLDGKHATSNKRAWAWAVEQNPQVLWEKSARFCVDGKFWTSSGVAAGMDMSLALIAHDFGMDVASAVAKRAEYVWNRDASKDPFARL
jgi:transcriptional regulator GlxA family with amidase domain